MDPESLKYAASLGVGGVLALTMFLIHRKDMQEHIERWRGQSEVLIQVVKENTSSNVKLIMVIEALHRQLHGRDKDS